MTIDPMTIVCFCVGTAIYNVGKALYARRPRRPQQEICTDISGRPHLIPAKCISFRNPFCSDGRCRYHCQTYCKCPEVV